MPTSLHARLAELADSFATQVLAAIRSASLDELVVESRRALPAPNRPALARADAGPAPQPPARPSPAGRLPRRTPAQIQALVEQVAALLAGKSDGLRSEHIQAALQLDKREMPRVLKAGLDAKAFRSRGARRATTYFA